MAGVRSVHVRISGEVQGVGYRAWTARNAADLGLAGWVRNCADGTVEALFRGAPDAVDEMLARAARGPRYARVDAVTVLGQGDDAAAGDDGGAGFVVRRGA